MNTSSDENERKTIDSEVRRRVDQHRDEMEIEDTSIYENT